MKIVEMISRAAAPALLSIAATFSSECFPVHLGQDALQQERFVLLNRF